MIEPPGDLLELVGPRPASLADRQGWEDRVRALERYRREFGAGGLARAEDPAAAAAWERLGPELARERRALDRDIAPELDDGLDLGR